jgi:hypothetical protein
MASKGGFKFASGFSLPVGLLLGVFFFLPWVSLRCEVPENLPMRDGQKRVNELMVASGWELTTGSVSPGADVDDPEEFREKVGQAQEDKSFPRARPWFAVGLAVPVLLVLAGLLGLGGAANSQTVGRFMVLLGIAGLVIGLLGLTVDYADEVFNLQQAESGDSGPAPPNEEKAKEALREALQTRGTVWLWLTIVLYAGVILVGGASAVLTPAVRRR